MSSATSWKTLGRVAPGEIEEARLQVHHALQLVSIAVGRAIIEPRDDDSHTALTWQNHNHRGEDVVGLWRGEPIAQAGGLRAGLEPADLVLTLGSDEDPFAETLELAGKTQDDGIAWLREKLGPHGVDPAAIVLDIYYDMPDHPVANGAPFSTDLKSERAELGRYYANLAPYLRKLPGLHTGATPWRTWPHHFDGDVLMPHGPTESPMDRIIGVGLSSGDVHYSEPYVYVTIWPHADESAQLPDLPAGQWHRGHFFGAVLTGSALVGEDDRQEERVQGFLATAVATGRELLGAAGDFWDFRDDV